jgi:hypothetical protein
MIMRHISSAAFRTSAMSKYYSRKWLNKQGTGFMECFYDDGLGSSWKEACVKFGDCNRIVSLDLSMGTKKDKLAKLQKISLMIDELIALKEVMEKVEMKK